MYIPPWLWFRAPGQTRSSDDTPGHCRGPIVPARNRGRSGSFAHPETTPGPEDQKGLEMPCSGPSRPTKWELAPRGWGILAQTLPATRIEHLRSKYPQMEYTHRFWRKEYNDHHPHACLTSLPTASSRTHRKQLRRRSPPGHSERGCGQPRAPWISSGGPTPLLQ